MASMSQEHARVQEAEQGSAPWRRWGPYLSERQWGSVREDYSESGDAWNYLTHDQARSRAYRWGEDGIAGISDDHQQLCFAIALWNGKDAILKERLFGLTNSEGNHGEDVKEYYFYLDSTPTHSYMKMLYKYPQSAFPYSDIIETNRRRSRSELEYELLDTGIFDEDRYFDEHVEVAVLIEHPGVEQLVLELLLRAAAVGLDEVGVGEFDLGVLVEHLHVGVGRGGIQVEVIVLDVLSVVAFAIGQPEDALFKNRVLSVPQGKREADLLVIVGDAGDAVLAPVIGSGAGLVVSEVVPGIARVAVVLPDRAPLALTQVWAPPPPENAPVVRLA